MQLIVIEHAGEPVGSDRFDAVVFHPPGGTIGRDGDNHLVLRDDTRQISRLQALLQVGDDACLLKNLSSVSTIEVNRVPIAYAQERPLNDGDIVRIGPYVLRAEREDAAGRNDAAPARTVDMTDGARDPAVPHDDANPTGNRLWGRLHDRFARGKTPDEAAPRSPVGQDGKPAVRSAAAPSSTPARDLHQLSTDPLDLFAQPSGDAGPDDAHSAAEGSQGSFTQADHAPEWTQHVRVQPAAASAAAPDVDADAPPP
ncbi:FHA domain-containing protein, partial [Burkholderia ubonensis]|uniref:FHA domain-containing protein n=1 Tax=Burkholderia ubonensis TaxID=101571 RepID=UPI00016A5874